MRLEDYDSFCAVVGGFAELKGKQLSPAAIELYWHAMSSWTLEDFRAAAAHLLKSCEFMPTPADFEKLKRAHEPTAAEAWDSVLSNRPLSDRARRAADIASGRRYIGHLDIERELPHVQRRFFEIYADLSEAEDTRDALPSLAETPLLSDDTPRLT
jgi:hypothetical protein